jgi:DnaJ-class molecular chaperone
MAARKPAARKHHVDDCPVCKGTGNVPVLVRVGRARQVIGTQTGLCLNCLGSGHAPATDSD